MTDRPQLRLQAAAVRLALYERKLLDGGLPPSVGEQEIRDHLPVARAFAEEAETLISKRAVVAVGTDRSIDSVVVYTSRAYTKRDLDQIRAGIDEALPIEFRTLGIGAQGPTSGTLESLPMPVRRDGRVTCGTSISIANDRGAATMGALVRDDKGAIHGLSCSHVIAGCGYMGEGMPILAPGVLDVTPDWPEPIVIGRFSKALPLVAGDPAVIGRQHNLDAAMFRITVPSLVSSFQGEAYDTPTSVHTLSEADEGTLEIEKVGRSSGHTEGVIGSSIDGPMEVAFSVVSYPDHGLVRKFEASVFLDQVWIAQSTGRGFARPGDSGALVVSRPIGRKKRRAVGLVVAGTKEENALILPISAIIKALGVALVSEHGV